MPDLSIQKDFVEGTHEIFTTLFNTSKVIGDEVDGMFLYLLSDKTIPDDIYGENKFKVYKKPLPLVVQSRSFFGNPETDIEVTKEKPTLITTLKSLRDNGLDVGNKGLDKINNGIIYFNHSYYKIERIIPKAYIEGVYLLYEFKCKEDKSIKSLDVED